LLRAGDVLHGQELLHGLVESLDLSAGLGVVGPRVLGLDTEREQLLLGHPGQVMMPFGRKYQPIVSEEGGPVTPGLSRFVERSDDIVAHPIPTLTGTLPMDVLEPNPSPQADPSAVSQLAD
jgi:hypothetical protein